MKTKRITTIILTVLVTFMLLSGLSLIMGKVFFKPSYTFTPNPMASTRIDYLNENNETRFYRSVIKNSTAGVVGKFVQYYVEDSLHTWVFEKENVIYGKVEESEFKIVFYGIDPTSENPIKHDTFKEGESYILFLCQDKSIFLEETHYGLMGEVYIPLSDVNSSTWARGEIEFGVFADGNKVIDYYRNLATERGFRENPFVIEAFYDKSLEYVVKNSKLVLRVVVTNKGNDANLRKQTTYGIKVVEALKGAECVAYDGSSILVNSSRDSLAENKEYILTLSLVQDIDKDSIFTLSALNGIIPIEDKETVEKVYEWLDLK